MLNKPPPQKQGPNLTKPQNEFNVKLETLKCINNTIQPEA